MQMQRSKRWQKDGFALEVIYTLALDVKIYPLPWPTWTAYGNSSLQSSLLATALPLGLALAWSLASSKLHMAVLKQTEGSSVASNHLVPPL